MTPSERAAKTFIILLEFSVVLASPRKRRNISARDIRFLLSISRTKYHEIKGNDFEKLLFLQEKYL